jgi:hypothetical protein
MGSLITIPTAADHGLINGERTSLSAAVAPIKEEAVEQEAPDFDFTDTYSKAADLHHIRPWDWDSAPEDGNAIDPLSKEWQDQIPNHWNDDQINALNEAETDSEWDFNFKQFEHRNKLEVDLAKHGLKGVGVELLAALTDPVATGAILATEGLAAPWIAGTKAASVTGILIKMGKAGLVGGATEAGLAALRNQQEADYTFKDAMGHVALGAAISAPFGLLMKGKGADAIAEIADTETRRAMIAVSDSIEEGVVEQFAKDGGAAAVKVPDQAKGFDFISDHGRAMRSENPDFRNAMNQMVEDGVKGGRTTVALEVDSVGKHFYGRLYRTSLDQFNIYAKEAGVSKLSVFKRQQLKQQFSEKVYRHIAAGVDPEDTTGAVAKVASEVRKMNAELLERVKSAGVKGFDTVESDASYMARYWHPDKFRSALDNHSPQKVASLIYHSLISNATKKTDDVDSEHIARIAIGFTNRMDTKFNAHSESLANILDDEDQLGDMLREFVTRDSEDDYKELLQLALSTKSNKASTDIVDRAKHRMDIDMTTEHEGLSILDLVDQDAVGNTHRYIASMVGHSAFANKMNIKSPSDWKAQVSSVAGNATPARRQKEIDKIEQMRKVLLGQPIWDTKYAEAQQVMRTVGKMNFTSAMGKAYFAAFGELGRIVNNNGLLTTLKHVPELSTIFKTMVKPTTQGKGIAREVNEFMGSIGDENLMSLWGRFDDNLIADGTATQGFLNKAEIMAHSMTNVMSHTLAPLAPVDKALRHLAFSTNTSHLYKKLMAGKKPKWDLKELDMDDSLLADLTMEMKRHTKVGKLGEVESLGIEKWNKATAERFMERMTRWNAKQVQRSLIGESNVIFSSPIGRMFTQFRTFMLDSYTKLFLNDAHHIANHRGMNAAGNIMWGSMFAGLQYAGRTYSASIGCSDQERYLRDHLDFEKSPFEKGGHFWANVINYNPSLGAPTAMYNTIASGFNLDPLQVSRSTGYRSDLVTFPSLEAIEKLPKISSGLSGDDPFDDKTLRMMATFVPFQNTVLGGAIINKLLR